MRSVSIFLVGVVTVAAVSGESFIAIAAAFLPLHYFIIPVVNCHLALGNKSEGVLQWFELIRPM